MLFPKFPHVFATFGNIDNKMISVPDVSHGQGVRQGPKKGKDPETTHWWNHWVRYPLQPSC